MQHQHHLSHARVAQLNRSFVWAILLNFTFTVIEIFYAYMAHSMSLLSDAIHNFGDVLGLVIAFVANWLLSFPATKRYSYGFKRTTILAALTNALLLFVASGMILQGIILKFLNPQPVNSVIMIWVATIGIGINGVSAFLFKKSHEDDLNTRSAFLHLLCDALVSIGVVLGAIAIYFWKIWWIDPVIGLVIVALVIAGTWGLLQESIHLLLDAVPKKIDINGVLNFLNSVTGVSEVHDLHIWGLSTQEVAMTVHLVVPNGDMTDEKRDEINEALKHHFHIEHVTIQIEKNLSSNCSHDPVVHPPEFKPASFS